MSKKEPQSGFLLIDKPKGWTSFDVVAKLRGITKVKKIGHAGTLDPLATGLLIIAIGKQATKQISNYMKLDKVYETTFMLGKVSTTYDADGEISDYKIRNAEYRTQNKIKNLESGIKNIETKNEKRRTNNEKHVTKEDLKKVINKYIGKIHQIPPMFSAKKVNGKKLYELARKGIEVERKPIRVQIHDIELLEYTYPNATIRVHCSTGTYIRTLVHDIGQALGVGAYVEELRRVKIGNFDVGEAYNIEDIKVDNWQDCMIQQV